MRDRKRICGVFFRDSSETIGRKEQVTTKRKADPDGLRALLNSACSGTDHRIHITKK